MENIKLGKRMKEVREQLGFSKDIVSKYLEIEKELLDDIETGKHPVSTDKLKKLSDLYGCRVSVFFNDFEKIEKKLL